MALLIFIFSPPSPTLRHFPSPTLFSREAQLAAPVNKSRRRRTAEGDAARQSELDMMLGKRQRPPMKRTTSLSEITFDLNAPVEAPPSDLQRQTTGYGSCDQRSSLLPPAASPRVRRHSIDFSDNGGGGQFLRSCALCKRRLVPSRDIYMYRGDRAFCSQECRQQQMSKDERKEKKCAISSKKLDAATGAAAGAKVAAKGETIAAV